MADLQTILHFVARFLNDSEHSHQFLFLRGTANELRLGKRIDRCRLVCFHLPRKLREVQSLICARGLKLNEDNTASLQRSIYRVV